MEQSITIEGRLFSLVRVQRTDAAVYRSRDFYLRIGSKAEIGRDRAMHEKMLLADFPVAKIISSGEYKGQSYFIEESLGDKHFGELFAEDTKELGSISGPTLESYLEITRKFAAAQLKTVGANNVQEFADGIQLATLCKELPDYERVITDRFADAIKNLSPFPFVVTHGDFNPNNLLPEGVIDLESSFYGPAGYDLITNIIHITYFPTSPDYEFFQHYQFNEGQKRKYLDVVDTLYQSHDLPALSPYLIDFEFCRLVWSAVRMDKYPKLQKFRYDLLIKNFLKPTPLESSQ